MDAEYEYGISYQEAKELLEDVRWQKLADIMRRMATDNVNEILDAPQNDENPSAVAWRRGFAKALMIASQLPESIVAGYLAGRANTSTEEDE